MCNSKPTLPGKIQGPTKTATLVYWVLTLWPDGFQQMKDLQHKKTTEKGAGWVDGWVAPSSFVTEK